MSVQGKPDGLTNWNIKVFENVGGDKYRLIQGALRRYFRRVDALDPQGGMPKSKTSRIFFVCQN